MRRRSCGCTHWGLGHRHFVFQLTRGKCRRSRLTRQLLTPWPWWHRPAVPAAAFTSSPALRRTVGVPLRRSCSAVLAICRFFTTRSLFGCKAVLLSAGPLRRQSAFNGTGSVELLPRVAALCPRRTVRSAMRFWARCWLPHRRHRLQVLSLAVCWSLRNFVLQITSEVPVASGFGRRQLLPRFLRGRAAPTSTPACCRQLLAA